ncbi:MAG: 2OG-Fe(II) oxygenase [Arenimonas sp.]
MADLGALALALRRDGWAIATDLVAAPLVAALGDEARAHRAGGRLQSAATGRAEGRQFTGLRGDSTLWLDDPACGDAAAALLDELADVRVGLDRRLLLGLAEVEAHFAHYPSGAAYVRHRDRFRDDDARVLSLVLYLNDDWPADAGGALRLHLPSGARDIAPQGGHAVLFLSDEIEHEVLPATRDRWSIAGWFRRRPR